MSDLIADAIALAPASPAGRQAAWCLTRLHAAGEGASLADNEHYAPALAAELRPASSDADVVAGWVAQAGRIGAFTSLAFVPTSDVALTIEVAAAKDRRWKFHVEVEPAPPHRLVRAEWERIHDFALEVREAGPADALTLSALESRCPIVLDHEKLWFDRGEAWFDFSRLMAECTVGLAFVDGEPGAVTCGARHAVRIGGVAKTILTVSHLRVLPEHQRKGLWGAVNRVLDKYWPTVDGSNAYISVDNAGMQHGFRHTSDKWPVTFSWLRLDTAALAGPAFGREATRGDAAAIAARLNAFHGGEEMFVPYTAESLAARVERAADLYGWPRLWLAPGAVVGVWPAGRALRLVTEKAGEQSLSESAVVLDYAFEPGAEAAFEALLRAWCGHLAARGMDRLALFTSDNSPGAAFLTSLAREVEAFNMWTPGIPVPQDAAAKGLYVDAVYF